MPDNTPTPRTPQFKFVPDARPLQGRSGNQPPLPAMVVMVAIIGLVGFAFAMEHWAPGFIRHNVPFGDSDYFWVGLIFLPMVALLVVAIATKLVELRQAKSWVPATGRILSSGVETRRHQFQGEPETVKNVPAVLMLMPWLPVPLPLPPPIAFWMATEPFDAFIVDAMFTP